MLDDVVAMHEQWKLLQSHLRRCVVNTNSVGAAKLLPHNNYTKARDEELKCGEN